METRDDERTATSNTPEISRSDRAFLAISLGGVTLDAFKHASREFRLDESKTFPNTDEVYEEAVRENRAFSENALRIRNYTNQIQTASENEQYPDLDGLKRYLVPIIRAAGKENYKIANGTKSLVEIGVISKQSTNIRGDYSILK